MNSIFQKKKAYIALDRSRWSILFVMPVVVLFGILSNYSVIRYSLTIILLLFAIYFEKVFNNKLFMKNSIGIASFIITVILNCLLAELYVSECISISKYILAAITCLTLYIFNYCSTIYEIKNN